MYTFLSEFTKVFLKDKTMTKLPNFKMDNTLDAIIDLGDTIS